MKIAELTVGCHILCGSIYKGQEGTFKIPSHYATVVSLGEDWVCTVADAEQGDPDEYSIEECEGIPLDTKAFISLGFHIVDGTNDRFFYNGKTFVGVNRDCVEIIENSHISKFNGIEYVHQLEVLFTILGIDYSFNCYADYA